MRWPCRRIGLGKQRVRNVTLDAGLIAFLNGQSGGTALVWGLSALGIALMIAAGIRLVRRKARGRKRRTRRTTCWCGRNATTLLLVAKDGRALTGGSQAADGGSDRYVSMCRRHWREAIDSAGADGMRSEHPIVTQRG